VLIAAEAAVLIAAEAAVRIAAEAAAQTVAEAVEAVAGRTGVDFTKTVSAELYW
jgi:hypothetical protein